MRETIETCSECGRKYKVKRVTYPSKLDEKRESYYYCPYCKSEKSMVKIQLLGNEDVEIVPL